MVDVQTLGKQGHSKHVTDYYTDLKVNYDSTLFMRTSCKWHI